MPGDTDGSCSLKMTKGTVNGPTRESKWFESFCGEFYWVAFSRPMNELVQYAQQIECIHIDPVPIKTLVPRMREPEKWPHHLSRRAPSIRGFGLRWAVGLKPLQIKPGF